MRTTDIIIYFIFLMIVVSTVQATVYPYWIEHDENNTPIANGKIWVKVNLSSTTPTELYVYYGGSTNKNNGEAVFEFFDDFEGTSVDWNKWGYGTYSSVTVNNSLLDLYGSSGRNFFVTKNDYIGNFLIKDRVKMQTSISGIDMIYRFLSASIFSYGFFIYNHLGFGSSGLNYDYHSASFSLNYFYIRELYVNGTTMYFIIYNHYGNYVDMVTTNSFDLMKGKKGYESYSEADFQVDWILIAKHDPTATIGITYGTEETGSWIINGEAYTKRKKITITSNKDLTDYQVALDYNQINDYNLFIDDYYFTLLENHRIEAVDMYEKATQQINSTINLTKEATVSWNLTINGTLVYQASGLNLTSISYNYTAPMVSDNTTIEIKVDVYVNTSTNEVGYIESSKNITIMKAIDLANYTSTNKAVIGGEIKTNVTFTQYVQNVSLVEANLEVYNSSNDLVKNLSCSSLSCSFSYSIAEPGNYTVNLTWIKSDGTTSISYTNNLGTIEVVDMVLSLKSSCGANEKIITQYLVYDEETKTLLSSAKKKIDLQYFNSVINKNTSIINTGNLYLCLSPKDVEVSVNANSFEEYSMSGYVTRNRFLRNALINGPTANTKVYLLNETKATQVLFQVRESGVTKSNVDVVVLRYYPEDSSYLEIANIRIGTDYGSAFLDVNQWYKFKVVDLNGNLLYEDTTPQQIVCSTNPCIKTISYSPKSGESMILTELDGFCVANTTANIIKCSFIDPTGKTKKVHFSIKKGKTEICNQTLEGSAGEYICDITGKADFNLDILSWSITREASPEILINSGIIDERNIKSIFYSWILIVISFILVMAFSYYFHIGISTALAGVGVFLLSVLNIIDLGIDFAATILLVSLIVGWILSR